MVGKKSKIRKWYRASDETKMEVFAVSLYISVLVISIIAIFFKEIFSFLGFLGAVIFSIFLSNVWVVREETLSSDEIVELVYEDNATANNSFNQVLHEAITEAVIKARE